MSKAKKADKILTLQVHHENLNPRSYRVPLRWLHRASWLAWALLGLSVISSVYALKEYFSERSARPELVKELENEIQELKIALERKATSVATTTTTTSETKTPVDLKATDQKPTPAPGEDLEGKDGVWTGLAENITAPQAGSISPIRLEDPRIDWQGKYANFTLNLVFKDPGKGSQQGHIVVLGRGNDRLFAHPEGVLNASSGAYLFTPDRGEYFSVARFRVLKARLGPFDNSKQLSEIQVFLFDLDHKLITTQNFHYGNK
jgi:hypothetical protein